MINKTPPLWIGSLLYIVLRPFIWFAIKGSTRAYVVVLAEDNVLLTKNWLGLHKKWRLPGGGVKKSEDPIVAAERELYEEVGLKIDKNKLTALNFDPIKVSKTFKANIYLIEFSTKMAINRNQNELSDAQWIPLVKINELNVSQEVAEALRAISK
jgi:8-oxo-dGTP pyrophosphatase MutT (NUDIX family)